MTSLNIAPTTHSPAYNLEPNPSSSARIDDSNAPELNFDLQNSLPELQYSSAPETVYNTQDFPPEVLSGPVFENPSDGLHVHSEKTGKSARLCTKKRWAALVVIVIAVAAIVGGVLGGTVGRRKKDSAQTSEPPKSIDESPTPSNGPSQLSATLLANTSIAATICPDGDRLLFFQDISGQLRVAQWSSNSDWAIRSNVTIPSDARLGTPLSASCVNIPVGLPSNVYLNPGRFVSLVYLNASTDAISQSVFTNGGWSDLQVPQASLLPSSQTKLSISSDVELIDSQSQLSSLVVYKSHNASLVMIDLTSELALLSDIGPFRPLKVNPNLFDRLNNSTSPFSIDNFDALQVDSGLACICNRQIDPLVKSSSQLFTQCLEAQIEAKTGQPIITELYLEYNVTYPTRDEQPVLGHSAYFRFDVPWAIPYSTTTYNGTTDISSMQLAQGREAMVYSFPNNTLQLQIGSAFSKGDPQGILGNPISPSNPSSIPYNHFSAASAGDKGLTIYIYYQANETSLAEISFDISNGAWSPQPSFITIP